MKADNNAALKFDSITFTQEHDGSVTVSAHICHQIDPVWTWRTKPLNDGDSVLLVGLKGEVPVWLTPHLFDADREIPKRRGMAGRALDWVVRALGQSSGRTAAPQDDSHD